jgi:(R,R)-butanediol dehydrogenase/meso-butanediol dehydrogenase/diacetyl reductase
MRGVALTGPGEVRTIEVPLPKPGPGQLLLRVDACGVCGSDLHVVEMGALPTGSVLGHEICGTVVAIGPGTEARLGERRVVWPLLACRQCERCRAGEPRRCSSPRRIGLGGSHGGWAEYVLVDADTSPVVPEELDSIDAALTEPLAVGLHSVRLSRLRPGDRCLVVGAGCIGLMVLQCALLAGALEVVVVERVPQRAAAARSFGATAVVDPAEASGGAFPPFDVAFECAGAPGTLQLCGDLTRPGGEVVGVGVCTEDRLRVPVWLTKELTLRMAFETQDVFPVALALLASGRVRPSPMVSRQAALEEAPEVIATELAGRREVKAVVVPHRHS